MHAIQFLLKEHEHVRNVFKDISDKSHRMETKREKLKELCVELLVHENMEETVWYPYLEKYEEVASIISHLLSEEKKAEKLINTIAKTSSEEEWEEQFAQLKQDVEHHASEEEAKLFPRVKQLLIEEKLKEIGKAMKKFKKDHLGNASKEKEKRDENDFEEYA